MGLILEALLFPLDIWWLAKIERNTESARRLHSSIHISFKVNNVFIVVLQRDA